MLANTMSRRARAQLPPPTPLHHRGNVPLLEAELGCGVNNRFNTFDQTESEKKGIFLGNKRFSLVSNNCLLKF